MTFYLLSFLVAFIHRKKYRFIITSGPTREYLDPIRFLSNPSTGKMGFYIAKAAVNEGYPVTYIVGPVLPPYNHVRGAKNISVISTRDMLKEVLKEIEDRCILIMAAAPADYRPKYYSPQKIKKQEYPEIHLVPNPDILKEVYKRKERKKWKNLILVGFAAETQNAEDYAKRKLHEKHLDMIFLNDLSRKDAGFGKDTNKLTLLRKDGYKKKWRTDTKERLGYKIIHEIEKWLELSAL